MPYDPTGERFSLRLLVFLLIFAVVKGIVNSLGKASFVKGGGVGKRLDNFYLRSRLKRRHLDLGVKDSVINPVGPLEYLSRLFRFRRGK